MVSRNLKESKNGGPLLVSLAFVAEKLECCQRTIARKSQEGVLPPIRKFGRLSRMDWNAVQEAIARLERKPGKALA